MAKIVRDWTKFIVPRVNKNTQANGKKGDKSFCTTDSISIKSFAEVKGKTDNEIQRSSTDFALMNFPWQSKEYKTLAGKRISMFWFRSAKSKGNVWYSGRNYSDFYNVYTI